MTLRERADRRRTIFAAVQNGMSIQHAAIHFGVTTSMVRGICTTMSHAERAKRRERIAAEILSGLSVQEAADKYRVSADHIRSCCDIAGEPRVSTFSSYSLIADLLNTDETLQALAEKHGRGKENVSLIYRKCLKAGIKVRKRKRGRPYAV
jgi:uncharacterized protein (DUF433 family)